MSSISTTAQRGPRHSTGRSSYLEKWAQRYPNSQAKIERGRLRQGKAKHRAHRRLLKAVA